jgi:hypothetical protein
LSWYENQIFDKNFYRGLRNISGKTEIIGAQLFVRPHTLLNFLPDDQEAIFDVIPDKVLVNGLGCLFESGCTKVDVGPSLRYAHLFAADICPSNGKIILVVMPFFDHVVRHILKIINDVSWPAPVKIKFHPSTDPKMYENGLPGRFLVTDKKISELTPEIRMVVGRSSGALVEIATLGIPVIDIQNLEEFSHDFMPPIGKGILWDRAVNSREVTKLVSQFQEALQSGSLRLKEEGTRLRSVYFSEPTDELIGQAFGLD